MSFDDSLLDAIQGASEPYSPPAQEAPSAPPPEPEPSPEPEAEVQAESADLEGTSQTPAEDPKTVPYDRFKQVNAERQALKQEMEAAKQGQEVLNAFLSGDRETWNTAIQRGLVPQDILQQHAASQGMTVPQAQRAAEASDPWASDESPGITQAQIVEIARQQADAANKPLIQALQTVMADRTRAQLKTTYGDSYVSERDDNLIRQACFQHPTLSAELAFQLTRQYVPPATGPAPPDPSRGQVAAPSSTGRTTKGARDEDAAQAKLTRVSQTRGADQLDALTDLIQGL